MADLSVGMPAPAPAFGALGADTSAPLLDARSISIRFGGVAALKDVSVTVAAGEAVGLVGPNGAGKTTLFNCMCGQLRPSSGTVTFDGHVLDNMPAHMRARLGIRRTFQRVEVFPELSVRDHMMVAERARRGDGALWKDLLNMGKPKPDEIAHVDEILDLVDWPRWPTCPSPRSASVIAGSSNWAVPCAVNRACSWRTSRLRGSTSPRRPR